MDFEIVLKYWNRGFSIIPIKSASKEPAIYWKEFQTRLPSYDELNEWKNMWENGSNLGIICGRVSGGLVVIDLDNQKTFDNFSSEYPELTKTWIVKTSRGYHVWLKSEDTRSRGTIRGDGRYVLAPPSVHPSGAKYTFLPGSKSNGLKQVTEIPDLQLIKLPSSIRTLITEGDVFGKYRSRSEADMAAICALVRFGYSDEEIRQIFKNENWKINQKFMEKGSSYLNFSIKNARSFISAKDAEINTHCLTEENLD